MMVGMVMMMMKGTMTMLMMMMAVNNCLSRLTQTLLSAANVTVPYRKGTSHEWIRQSQ